MAKSQDDLLRRGTPNKMICPFPFSECEHKFYNKERAVFLCGSENPCVDQAPIKESKINKFQNNGQTELNL